jgi:hypothetical protein
MIGGKCFLAKSFLAKGPWRSPTIAITAGSLPAQKILSRRKWNKHGLKCAVPVWQRYGIAEGLGYSRMGTGLQRWFFSSATLPQAVQVNRMAASLSRQTWRASTFGVPQKLQVEVSSQGLHKCPGVSATAPQVVHV